MRCRSIIAGAAALALLWGGELASAQATAPPAKPGTAPGSTAAKQSPPAQKVGAIKGRGAGSAATKPTVVVVPLPSAPAVAVVPGQATPKTAGQAAPKGTVKPAPPAQKAGAGPSAARPAERAVANPTAPVLPPPVETYTYHAEGRRDPFVSLLNRGSDARQSQRKIEGLAGLSVGDATLRGILQSRGQFIAIVQGPDGKRPYIVRANDRFADGVVRAITADSMLILQEVNDPLSLTKQREIRKTLRAVEEVK